MGCCSSSPETKYEASSVGSKLKQPSVKQVGAGTSAAQLAHCASKRSASVIPDFGLAETHEVIKLLGRGGEGETWLCKEKDSGLEVAIKLIKRPIPKPAIAIIKREIKIQADMGQGQCNIVSADEVILSKTHLGLVLEYIIGELSRGQVGGRVGVKLWGDQSMF